MDRTVLPLPLLYSLIIIFILLLFGLLLARSSAAAEDNSTSSSTITRTQYITSPQTIITSPGNIFRLGFFKPYPSSSNSYVGIWYTNDPLQKVVWVANRKKPVTDSSGVVMIADDGNLVILDGKGIVVWSTNGTVGNNSASSSVIAELLDTGNLVLWQQKKMLWQSFDFPTDTFLPTMKIGVNRRTGKNIQLTTWKYIYSDSSMGNYTLGVEVIDSNMTQIVIQYGSDRIWRSGPWNNNQFLGAYSLGSLHITRDLEEEDGIYVTFNDTSVRYILHDTGVFSRERWNQSIQYWETYWSSNSDYYRRCGHNMIQSCACVPGYNKLEREEERDSSGIGCVREKEFQCERSYQNSSSSNNNNSAVAGDKFVVMNITKPPDFARWLGGPKNNKTCGHECLKNCSCIAYLYADGIGCMTWAGSLNDIWVTDRYKNAVEVELYIRIAAPTESLSSTPANASVRKGSKRNPIIISVVIGTFAIVSCTYFFWRLLAKQRGLTDNTIIGKSRKDSERMENISINVDNEGSSNPDMLGDNMDLQIFKFENIVIATNNFCRSNKLGEGGFGPVYKGKFANDGQEIAVKRLSKCSLQGSEEFKNEVLVILKLQHRNLVRLLGCCMEGEERLLIYEYMPNNSLDAFIFDSEKQGLLDWRKRFQIIDGISRGIIYLHRDSRLKVIHRDLKASNILLDEELNPKISDFGMARIFGSNELQANTGRVVGTYGYMSPEYAMGGLFSEKSDVFSFGVLLLEIVSGRRNTSFYNHEVSSSLLGYAWKLWNDNQIQLLIDPTLLAQPNCELEILRCIHVGLLCVQDFAEDRPTMYTALAMLTSEISSLPTPKQPVFTDRRVSSYSNPSQINTCSLNNFTISNVVGR